MEPNKQLPDRIDALEQRLAQLEKKLDDLERSRAAFPQAHLLPVSPPLPPKVSPLGSAGKIPPGQSPVMPQPTSTPAAGAIFAQSDLGPIGATKNNVETVIAGRWLHYVGILAVLFAVAFFLQYAFQNNWIGPRGRIGIGLVMGSALFPWSHRLLANGYKYFSEGIAGLGAAVLYLSLWSGWHFYSMFSQPAAFALMTAVTAATVVVSLGRDSQRIAVLAVLGGLLTPELISTGENQEVVLFSYLFVLGAAVLFIAWARSWKVLPPIQFLATLGYFWVWYSEFYREDELLVTTLFASLFFSLFAAVPVVQSRSSGELSTIETGMVLLNAFAYLSVLRAMLWPGHRWALTFAVLLLSAAHLGVERALSKEDARWKSARVLFAGLALTFVTLAIPIRLEGRWVTIAWAVEGMILLWSGLRVPLLGVRAAGFGLLAVAAARLALIPIAATRFVFNARFATFATFVVCCAAAYRASKKARIAVNSSEVVLFGALAVAANIYAIAALSCEVWDTFDRARTAGIDAGLAQQLALSTVWLLYALALIVVGMRRKSSSIRWQALALLGLVIGKVFLFDLSFLDRVYRILSFFLLGVVLLLISFFYQKYFQTRGSERSL